MKTVSDGGKNLMELDPNEPTKFNIADYAKYWHIFSWILLCLLGKPMSLENVYLFSQEWAERDGHMGSWLDVFDGILWICSIVGIMIGIGFWMK